MTKIQWSFRLDDTLWIQSLIYTLHIKMITSVIQKQVIWHPQKDKKKLFIYKHYFSLEYTANRIWRARHHQGQRHDHPTCSYQALWMWTSCSLRSLFPTFQREAASKILYQDYPDRFYSCIYKSIKYTYYNLNTTPFRKSSVQAEEK